MSLARRSALAAILWIASGGSVSASELASRAVALLEAECLGCHGAAQMSGLDLRTRAAAQTGGKRGAALGPLLLDAVRRTGDLQMPPGKKALTPDQVALLEEWIDAGAPWPDGAQAADEPKWWSFRKPVRPPIPGIEAAAGPIDAFLLAKLEAQGLTPAAQADRRTLIRRLTFDLHGLPPTPERVEAFVADSRPDAYERLVDELLASPRYGERWGRHWLDVVRYADTGGFETDVYFASAWRYRDYVIESFNRDKPYDQFVQEQIAADEIWPDNLDLDGSYLLPESKKENLHRRIGTGLYTLGAFPVEITFYGDQYRAEWQAEAVDVTGAAFLGLTLGCARCHDHKFDPLPQRDYYRMAAMFAGSEEREIPIVSRMGIYEFTRHQAKWAAVEQIEDEIDRLDRKIRTEDRKATPAERDRRETLLRNLGAAYLKAPEPVDVASLLVHVDGPVPDTHILNRGDWRNKGDKVEPGVPAALGGMAGLNEPDDPWFIPRRRKALAQWLTSADNPLFARVMVNRIWQGHFGRGIVSTPNDFGRQGAPPSHPELLDWLAVEFAESGFSIKHMHRLIATTAAYRRSSLTSPADLTTDPENVYLARMSRRRLEAEAIRDAALSAAGTLNLAAGGPAVVPPLTQEEMDGMRDRSQWPVTSDESQHTRRSVYLFVKRSFRLPMFEAFNAPDSIESCARRESSTVAPQALTLVNGRFLNKQAEAFAARLRAESSDPSAQVGRAFRLAVGRAPQPDEARRAEALLAAQGLERLCLLLFNLSEFLYVH